MTFKKKTVFWLSIWKEFFKVAFYFTEKYKPEIEALDIDTKIKADFMARESIGKLYPLVINVYGKENLRDIIMIAGFKKNLK